MRTISECSGMEIQEPFQYMTSGGKKESDTTLLTAMLKYGNDVGRISTNTTLAELKYLQKALDPQLMKLLQYRHIQEADLARAAEAEDAAARIKQQ